MVEHASERAWHSGRAGRRTTRAKGGRFSVVKASRVKVYTFFLLLKSAH